MRIDETLPGFCRCRLAYTPHDRHPYPYLSAGTDEDTPTATPARRLRIQKPLPVPDTFRNGLATERTPSVIKPGSDVQTDIGRRHRNRQERADFAARRRLLSR